MSSVPSITASGLGLLGAADAANDPAADPSASATADVVDAAVGVIYGKRAFEIGVKLIAVGRDTEKSLLDILA